MTDLAQELMNIEIRRIPLVITSTQEIDHNIVLFDDGVYSGEQMERVLKGMIASLERRKGVDLSKMKFIVACPYMTTKGEEVLKKIKTKAKIIILKHENIPSIEEAIAKNMKAEGKSDKEREAVLNTLNRLYWGTENTSESSPKPKGESLTQPHAKRGSRTRLPCKGWESCAAPCNKSNG